MRPPNLKVSARREYVVESGLTKGKERDYLIGYEGAATTKDTIISVTTEWLDQDGSPLPEGLGDYGYTGRLAKINEALVLGSEGNAVAQFPIRPGSRKQLVRFKGDYVSGEHLYVQVSGESDNKNPDFSTLGAGEGPLQYRPKHYVLFLVPILDEDATLRQYNAYRALLRDESIPKDTLKKPKGIVHWVYRPEMKFSVYDLQVKHLYRETEKNKVDILPLEVPQVLVDDDLLKLAYDLISQQAQALPYLNGGQELIFAFGEEELSVKIGKGGELLFTNLEHFALLDPEDFLSIRLYANNDSANILWEFAFGINGLHVSYKIPHIETEITLEQVNPTRKLVRTLGGLRLKYRYQPPANEKINAIEWTFNADGWFCKGPSVAHSTTGANSCQHTPSGTIYTQNIDDDNDVANGMAVWWEPSTGGASPESRWEDNINFLANYNAQTESLTTQQIQNREAEFTVESRPLVPNVDEPMEGADVAMLEQMLWQLGLGPNDSSRKGNHSVRKSTNLDVFDIGCSVGGCSSNNGTSISMEWMVWRFKFANEITVPNNVTSSDVTLIDTNFDSDTLNVLKHHWQDYYNAYIDFLSSPVVTAHNQLPSFSNWLSVSSGWSLNGTAIYTPTGITTNDLLSAIISKESGDQTNLTSGFHWGDCGSNTTPYRLNGGSADSWASFGFSQIKSRYIYGKIFGGKNGTDSSRCDELASENPYSPEGAISSIVDFSIGQSGSCGRSFRFALNASFLESYTQSNDARIIQKHTGTTIVDVNQQFIAIADDDYALTSKAIGGYNQGPGSFTNVSLSWADAIKRHSLASANDTDDISALRKAISYSIAVKGIAGFPSRNYIWMITETRIPGVNDPWQATSFSYCFTFGEDDWGAADFSNKADRVTNRQASIDTQGVTTSCP